MSYYDRLKEKIADYIVRDEVVEDDKVISAYTLFKSLDSAENELKNDESKNALLDKLNSFFPDVKETLKKGIINKKKFSQVIRNKNKFDKIIYCWERHNKTPQLLLCRKFNRENTEFVSLYRPIGDEDIYTDRREELDPSIIEECRDELMTSFDIVEFYLKLSKQFDKTEFSQKITNGDFYFSISWNDFSLANHYIDLTEEADPENYQNAKCFGKDKTIKDIIKENEETILRNTPIKLKKLDPFFVALVKRYKSKEIQKTYKKEA